MHSLKVKISSEMEQLRKELSDFLIDVDKTTNLEVLVDPFMFTFMIFDKVSNSSNQGYKWLFLDQHLNKINKLITDQKFTFRQFKDIRDFVYLGGFYENLDKCSGASWRLVNRGLKSIMTYNLNDDFGDYYAGMNFDGTPIYSNDNLTNILNIEKQLWSPFKQNSKDQIWVIQKEIFRTQDSTVSESENFFSLQIVGRLSEDNFTKHYKNLTKLYKRLEYKVSTILSNIEHFRKIREIQTKTAIISILVDSYAHNISAHSLAALKWWFHMRAKNMLDNNIKLKDSFKEDLKSNNNGITRQTLHDIAEKTKLVYEEMGIKDTTNDENFTSLLEIIENLPAEYVEKIFSFSDNTEIYNYRFPVPLDNAMYNFIRFLRDKAGFWSGVTRDVNFGGESFNLYDILWNDLASNPLYLGTIAHSEGINKINIHIKLPCTEFKNEDQEFAKIDLSIMKRDEVLIARDQSQLKYKIEYQENKVVFNWERIEEVEYNLYWSEDKIELDNLIHSLEEGKFEKRLEEKFNLPKSYSNEFIFNYGEHIEEKIYFYLITSFQGEFKLHSHISIDFSVISENVPIYRLLTLGKDHEKLRNKLYQEKYDIFLPGGIVGKHAFFTIIENTLRNIKHYKNSPDWNVIQRNGIDLVLSIQPEFLMKRKLDNLKYPQLFSISIYLKHKNNLVDNKQSVIEKLRIKTAEQIINDSGSPKLGGSSQDKICAAMLFNGTFISVNKDYIHDENLIERNNFYYNSDLGKCSVDEECYRSWIGFNHEIVDKNNKLGYIKKSIFLWKSELILQAKSKNDLKNENINRFKFLETSNKEVIKIARENGVIRIINLTKNESSYNKFFSQWLMKWLRIDNIKIQFIKECEAIVTFIFKNESFVVDCNLTKVKKAIKIPIAHGENSASFDNIKLRNHGVLLEKLFHCNFDRIEHDLKDNFAITKNSDNNFSIKKRIFDLIETVATKIAVFDDRLYERFMSKKKDKAGLIHNTFNIDFYAENQDNWKNVQNLKLGIDLNFLILHLSFIEKIEHNNENYTEDKISDFINNEILCMSDDKKVPENFILAITTGRGRIAFWDNLDEEQKQFVTFKPIESFLSALEDALIFDDEFQIKYNICKVLFGS